MDAKGVNPNAFMRVPLMMINAAAPSESVEELGAVTVPVDLNAGFTDRNFSSFRLLTSSSVVTHLLGLPRPPGTSIGIISSAKRLF
jgi:hypothetical protein